MHTTECAHTETQECTQIKSSRPLRKMPMQCGATRRNTQRYEENTEDQRVYRVDIRMNAMKAKQNLRNTTSRLDQASIKRDKKCEQHISIKPTHSLTRTEPTPASFVESSKHFITQNVWLAGWVVAFLYTRDNTSITLHAIYTPAEISCVSIYNLCWSALPHNIYIHALYSYAHRSVMVLSRRALPLPLTMRTRFSFVVFVYKIGLRRKFPETRNARRDGGGGEDRDRSYIVRRDLY